MSEDIKTVLTDADITLITRSFGELRTQKWMHDLARAVERAALSASASDKKDAERYCFLRAYNLKRGESWQARIGVPVGASYTLYRHVESEAEHDQAIDAAIAASKSSEGAKA
jgi:hypothetical protein